MVDGVEKGRMVFMWKASGWLPPLLGLGLAVGLPWCLLVSGKLEQLASAVEMGASIVIAEFTLALWWATQTQAVATERMRHIQDYLVSLERTPNIVVSDIEFSEPLRVSGSQNRSTVNISVTITNLGRHGVVVKEVAAYVQENHEIKHPIRLTPVPVHGGLVINPNQSVKFSAENGLTHEEAYSFFRVLESCLPRHNRLPEAWSCVWLALKVVHGGDQEESGWLCFRLQIGHKNGGSHKPLGYRVECGKGVATALESASLLH